MRAILTCVCASILVSSCGSPGVIYDKDPFFTTEVAMPQEMSEPFILRSIQFSEDSNLKISVNRFGNGKFSVLLYNNDMNITALNTVHDGRVIITSISRGEPRDIEIRTIRNYMSSLQFLLGNPDSEAEGAGPGRDRTTR